MSCLFHPPPSHLTNAATLPVAVENAVVGARRDRMVEYEIDSLRENKFEGANQELNEMGVLICFQHLGFQDGLRFLLENFSNRLLNRQLIPTNQFLSFLVGESQEKRLALFLTKGRSAAVRIFCLNALALILPPERFATYLAQAFAHEKINQTSFSLEVLIPYLQEKNGLESCLTSLLKSPASPEIVSAYCGTILRQADELKIALDPQLLTSLPPQWRQANRWYLQRQKLYQDTPEARQAFVDDFITDLQGGGNPAAGECILLGQTLTKDSQIKVELNPRDLAKIIHTMSLPNWLDPQIFPGYQKLWSTYFSPEKREQLLELEQIVIDNIAKEPVFCIGGHSPFLATVPNPEEVLPLLDQKIERYKSDLSDSQYRNQALFLFSSIKLGLQQQADNLSATQKEANTKELFDFLWQERAKNNLFFAANAYQLEYALKPWPGLWQRFLTEIPQRPLLRSYEKMNNFLSLALDNNLPASWLAQPCQNAHDLYLDPRDRTNYQKLLANPLLAQQVIDLITQTAAAGNNRGGDFYHWMLQSSDGLGETNQLPTALRQQIINFCLVNYPYTQQGIGLKRLFDVIADFGDSQTIKILQQLPVEDRRVSVVAARAIAKIKYKNKRRLQKAPFAPTLD